MCGSLMENGMKIPDADFEICPHIKITAAAWIGHAYREAICS